MADDEPPQGQGCAVTLAALLGITVIVLLALDQWAAAMFVGLAFAVFVAGLLDPG
jgi:hypothetical protein